jgi:type II secretory pathway component PulM
VSFNDKWSKLDGRDQNIVKWGGSAILIILIYAFIWDPWHVQLNTFKQQLPVKRSDAAWIAAQAELAAGVVQSGGTRPVVEGPILTVVEKSAVDAGIRGLIKQMSPGEEDGQVRIWLDGASFDQWLNWIDDLYLETGVQIMEVSAQRTTDDKADIRAVLSK